jgi:hypothetical protein
LPRSSFCELCSDNELLGAFAIPPARNIGNVIFFLALAAVLLGLYHYVNHQRPLEYNAAGS